MPKPAITLLAVALLIAALPVPAQMAETTEVTGPIVLPLSGELNAGEMARVVTGRGRPAECLAPVAVTRIDGRPRAVPAQGFLIEPGVHAFNGRATLDTANCPLAGANPYIGSAADLEVELVAGSTYYIGFYHQPADTTEWKLVVWRVEPGVSQ
jgi:hypothetical protein